MTGKPVNQWMRIAELESLSGVSRRTIHFYLHQGLLHPPKKTGQTMAYYDSSHLDELERIKAMRDMGLPLVAIREAMAGPATDSTALPPAGKDKGLNEAGSNSPVRSDGCKPKGQRTREKILRTGSRIFLRNGYRDTRVNDITGELGMSKGTFYVYFRDKKELFLACAPQIFDTLFSTGWARIRQIADPVERLQMRASMVLPVLEEFCAILQLSREAMSDPDPALRQLGRRIYLSIRRPLEKDIQKGIELRIFNPVVPRVAAALLIGSLENLNALQALETDLKPQELWDAMSMMVQNGLLSTTPDTESLFKNR